ncbi:MAG: hypothetical protein AB9866_29065 [Syntrophobacteraceae bacterium]
MSNYKDYLDRLIPITDLFVLPLNGAENGSGEDKDGETTGEKGIAWTIECVRKMLQPISFADYYFPRDAETRRKLIDLAWYHDPASWEASSEWSDAAIAKMREPVYQGWRLYVSAASLKRLSELC